MILKTGEKILAIHRQLYEGDARRHFVGTVEVCDGALARVNGYLFAMDPIRQGLPSAAETVQLHTVIA